MTVTTDIKLEGAGDLLAALAELSTLTSERTSRATITKEMDSALEPVADYARALAPRGDGSRKRMADGIGVGGTLKKSQRLSAGASGAYAAAMRATGDKTKAREMLANARRAEREAGNAAAAPPIERYVGVESGTATLVEFGTGPRFHKSGKFVGIMPARPFLRPAWDSQGPAVMSRLTAGLAIALAKKIARAKKKMGRG